ncbi:MAG: hypothetical protein DRJ05_12300, partial [Bacteroidetes bacterium]
MKQLFIIGVIMLILSSCGQKSNRHNDMHSHENERIDDVLLKIPVILSNSLENQRREFERIVFNAQKNVQEFAGQHDWKHLTTENFIDSVIICASKQEFDKTVKEFLKMDLTTVLPKSFSACLENRTLISVSPNVYAALYPEGIEDKSFEKLLTHEISHRLHIRVLDGNEDAMGPIWFFEGFAIYAANQFSNSKIKLSENEIWEIIENAERGSYEKYAFVFRHFKNKTSLNELV